MPFVEVPAQLGDSVHLHYQDYGSGRPVVLIHGWPLSGRSWEAQVPALIEAGYRVVTYDRRGFGQSSQPWDGYDYDTFAADLDALLTHLDLSDVALVGFSMGGGEVARYIGRYGSERVSAAVFAAAVPPYLYYSEDNPDGGLDDKTIAGFEGGASADRPAFLKGFFHHFFAAGDKSDLVSPEQHDFAQYLAFAASPKATLDCIAAFGRTDFRGDLTAITVPTLVIHGDSDGVVPFEVSGKRTHESIAGSKLVVIEGGPHGINASHVDEFNGALLDFLGGAKSEAASAEPAAAPAPAADSAAATVAAAAPLAAAEDSAGRHEAEADAPVANTTEPAASQEKPDWPPPREEDTAEPAAVAPAAAAAPAQFLEEPDEQAPSQEKPAWPPPSQQSFDEPPPAEPTPAQPAPAPTPAQPTSATAESAPASTGAASDPLAGARDSAFVWTTNEDDGVVPDDQPVDATAVRRGAVPDPNLGDVPVDEQPHPGS